MTFPGLQSSKAFGDEFRQHDGVVTMMMFYRRRASPKLRDDMTEVEYGGGGHHTRLRDQEINCCVYGVPPAPVYKGARGEAAGQGGGRAKGGVLLPPPFLVGVGEKERGGEGEGKGGCTPCPIRTRGGLRASFLLASLLYSRMAQ